MKTRTGVRFIALLEATKGLLVLLAGFTVLSFIDRDAQRIAEELVRQFRLNPASPFPRIFVEAAAHSTNSTLWLLAGAAFAYAAMRLFEAFGLWHQRRWAEWLAVLSAALYIPIELYALMHGVTWPKLTILAVNIACVVYLARVLRSPVR